MSAGATTSSATALDQQSTRDSYIPVFDGTPANYKEWRKRIIIYAKKMELMNRKGECVLNLLGSLQGTAWKLVEDFDLESVSGDTALKDILALLDAAFQYDSKVEMPADFAAYFESQGRRSGQSLLQFITDHDDRLRRVEKHGVKLPAEVQGWHLLAKSNISKEQKQMVMTQANSLERTKIQQALYSILGQDYTSTAMFQTPADGLPHHALLEKVVDTMWMRTTMPMKMTLGATWLKMTTLPTMSTTMVLGKMMATMMSLTVTLSTTRKLRMIPSWMTTAMTLTSTMNALQAMWMLDEGSTNFACREASCAHQQQGQRKEGSWKRLAWSFLMGYGPFCRYLDHLKKLNFPVHEITLKKANRNFHFGGDHQAVSSWTVHLPIFVNHQFGLVQAFLLKGETPMLLGRPITKALGMSLDFLNDRIKFNNGEWRDATLGRHSEYLLPLTEDFDPAIISNGAAFDLVLEDEDGPNFTLEHFQTTENVYMADEHPAPEGSLLLKGKLLKSIDNSVLTRLKAAEAYIAQTLHDMEERRPRKLWEVYCGHGRTSEIATSFGMETQRFGFETGWNFSLRSHQRAFMDLLDEELPDEVLLAPSCSPWSPMQNANMQNERKCQQLQQLREWHHRVHLRFCRRIYLKQLGEGRHAHLEQPTPALSWKTSSLRDLPGHRARFHQCQYGCVCMTDEGSWMPVRKDTTILTSKAAVAQAMNRLCPGDHQHCRLEGHLKGFNTLKTTFMQDYQPAMAATLAAAIASPEVPHPWDFGFAVQEVKEHVGKMIDLHVEGKAEALRVVQKLHRNLGHPSTKSLVELLQSRNASETLIQVAGTYVCAACQRYRKPNQPAPSSVNTVENFNQKVQSDVFWIKEGGVKYPILSNIDMATKYQTATLLHKEKTGDLITGFERSWIAHFGPPAKLLTDEGRGWVSDQMAEWTDSLSINHEVAPGEAHTRMSLVERRHAVLRKAIEVYISDLDLHGPDGLRTALTYILPQLNAQPTVAGYSPSQWLLGYQPSIGNLLTSDQITPVHLAGGSSFEEALQRRNMAKTAILQADTDQKLRRALLRRYAGDNIKLSVGQTCYFWRDAQQSDLVKIRWKGPAKVLMVECDGDGKPTCYWICYKTQLIRCAPHHCRPDFHALATNVIDNLEEAKNVIRQIKSRGVTRYLDLNRVNKQLIDDVEEDEEMMSDSSNPEQISKRRRLAMSPAPSVSYEPSLADDEVPIPPEQDDAANNDLIHNNGADLPQDVPVPDTNDNVENLFEPSAEPFPPTPMATSPVNPISTPTFPDQHVSVQSPSQFPLSQPPLSSVQQPPPSSLPLPSHVSAPQDMQHSEPQTDTSFSATVNTTTTTFWRNVSTAKSQT